MPTKIKIQAIFELPLSKYLLSIITVFLWIFYISVPKILSKHIFSFHSQFKSFLMEVLLIEMLLPKVLQANCAFNENHPQVDA